MSAIANADPTDTFPQTPESKKLRIPDTVIFDPAPPPEAPPVESKLRLLGKFFGIGGKEKLPELCDLPSVKQVKAVAELNRAEAAWLAEARTRPSARTIESEQAISELLANPCDATLEKAAEALERQHKAPSFNAALDRLIMSGTMTERRQQRTVPAVREALTATIEHLSAHRRVVVADDEKRLKDYGLAGVKTKPKENPILRELDLKTQMAEALLSQLPDKSATIQAVQFVLDLCKGDDGNKDDQAR